MSLVMSLQAGLVLPLLLYMQLWCCYLTGVVYMRVNLSLHNDCKANKAALSSRQLIWSEVSSAVHIPPVVVPRHSTPHLIFEASDYNNIRLTPLNRGWKFIHIIGPPYKVLPNRVRHSHESITITTVSERAAFKQSPFFTKHRNKPKHQGEPQQDNQ